MRRLLWCVALGLALTLGAGCAPDKPELPKAKVVRPVVVVKVQEPAGGLARSFSGVAKAAIETRLAFRVGGTIVELPAKIGRRVKKGDLIARLDPTDYRLRVEQLVAELARVETTLKRAASEYERVRGLYEVGSATASDLDRARAGYDGARAAREFTRRQLDLARKQLDYTVLRAPMAGAISAVPVEVHQVVAAGQTVAVLAAEGGLEVEIGVPENLIGLFRPGQEGRVSFDALPGETFAAVVSEVGVATGASSTYPVRLRLRTSDRRIRPGMVCEADFDFPRPAGRRVVMVPPEAVVGASEGRRYVWVFDPKDRRVHRRQVRVGRLTSEGLSITAGLKPGEQVVVRGVHRLQEGLEVRPLPLGSRYL